VPEVFFPTAFSLRWIICFFFPAEDGIRDFHVTGVQTCALPIWGPPVLLNLRGPSLVRCRPLETRPPLCQVPPGFSAFLRRALQRSEERRAGKEWRSRWPPDAWPKQKTSAVVSSCPARGTQQR